MNDWFTLIEVNNERCKVNVGDFNTKNELKPENWTS